MLLLNQNLPASILPSKRIKTKQYLYQNTKFIHNQTESDTQAFKDQQHS